MRALFRNAFQVRYGQPWQDSSEYSRFFAMGGVAPWAPNSNESYTAPTLSNGKSINTIDMHVRNKILGPLDECDSTALNEMLVWIMPPHQPSTEPNTPLLRCFLPAAAWYQDGSLLRKIETHRDKLLPGDAVKIAVRERNQVGAHCADTQLTKAGLDGVRGKLEIFAAVCFAGNAAARSRMQTDIQRALESFPGGVGPLDQFRLKSSNAHLSCDKTGQKLGRGNFADVWSGLYSFRNGGATPVAFKVLRDVRTIAACTNKNVERELSIGVRIRHPNLVAVFGAIQLQDQVAIVMELMSACSLHNLLHETESRLQVPCAWPDRCRYALNVVCGMEHLHDVKPNPVIHRDLKSGNVLLAVDLGGQWSAKVADYGLSKELTSSIGSTYAVGTLAWSAPETFARTYNEKSDVFSFAIVLYEIASRTMPHAGKTHEQTDWAAKARFKFSQRRFDRKGETEAEQLEDWQEDNPLAGKPRASVSVLVDCASACAIPVGAARAGIGRQIDDSCAWVRTACPV